MRTEHTAIRTLACFVAMTMFSTGAAVYAQTRSDSITILAPPTVTPPPTPPFPIGDRSNTSVTVPGKKPPKIRPEPKGTIAEKQISRPKYIGETEK